MVIAETTIMGGNIEYELGLSILPVNTVLLLRSKIDRSAITVRTIAERVRYLSGRNALGFSISFLLRLVKTNQNTDPAINIQMIMKGPERTEY